MEQAGISNLRVLEPKPREASQPREILEPRIRNLRAAEISQTRVASARCEGG